MFAEMQNVWPLDVILDHIQVIKFNRFCGYFVSSKGLLIEDSSISILTSSVSDKGFFLQS